MAKKREEPKVKKRPSEKKDEETVKRACSIRSAKDKGAKFQKSVLTKLRNAFGFSMFYDIRTTVGRETGADIKYMNEAARDIVGLAIECKNSRSINILKALDQAKKYNDGYRLHEAAIFKFGGIGSYTTYIAVPLDHYLDMRKSLLTHDIPIRPPSNKFGRLKKAGEVLATKSDRVVSRIPGSDPVGETKGCSECSCDGETCKCSERT